MVLKLRYRYRSVALALALAPRLIKRRCRSGLVAWSEWLVARFGMGKVSDDDTWVVLRKLACCFPAFYALYYGAAAIVCAAFGLFDAKPAVFGKMPFNFELFDDFRFEEKPKLGACWPSCYAPCAACHALVSLHERGGSYCG